MTFADRARIIHNNKYDYSKVVYVNNKIGVVIVCPEHGEFKQSPKSHLSGHGCKLCGIYKTKESNTLFNRNTRHANFINSATVAHGDKYDYSKVEYINNITKISITCPEHGEFKQTPLAHLKSGCGQCARTNKNRRSSSLIFTQNARSIHGDKYDYCKVEYVNNNTDVIIICPKHGSFAQSPHNHLAGKGCRSCGDLITLNHRRNNVDDFIEESHRTHNNKYDYSKVEYVNNKTKVSIICPVHGLFEQTPLTHKRRGCGQCAIDAKKNSLSDFISRSQLIHDNKYDYSKVEYVNNLTKVIIVCPEHGEFRQPPVSHNVYCYGCPQCRQNRSQLEIKIENEFRDFSVIINDRESIGDGKEIDLYFPDHSLGVEINGLYWHRDSLKGVNYHQNKFLSADRNNIRLLQFWEHEISDKWDLVISMIRHNLGLSNKLYARQCVVMKIDNSITKNFLNNNHMQGYRPSSINYGLYYRNELVSVLTISRHKLYEWEIIRFCGNKNSGIIGGFSKLLTKFKRDYDPHSILTFADLRYSVGGVYKKNGFNVVSTTKPNYFYFRGSSRNNNILSRQKCQKHKLSDLLGGSFDNNKTELENMTNAGYHKVSDAGNLKLIWNK